MNIDTASTHVVTPDLKVFGNPDMWQLLTKASSTSEGWMRSTKALEVPGAGCFIQVSTQKHNNVAEAICFVRGIEIVEDHDADGKLIGRHLSRAF